MQHLLCCQEKKESDNVRVAVRCRPLNQKEKESNFKMAIKVYLLLCYRYKYVVTFLQGHVFYSFDRWMSELDKSSLLAGEAPLSHANFRLSETDSRTIVCFAVPSDHVPGLSLSFHYPWTTEMDAGLDGGFRVLHADDLIG